MLFENGYRSILYLPYYVKDREGEVVNRALRDHLLTEFEFQPGH